MKVDRRSFLSFMIGGAAGTALSPLPWKLIDDVSIWTQNWPWTPVPSRGEVSYVTSTCTLCPGGCGISVRKVGNRVVKIEGLAGHPVNDGGLCTLGFAGAQLLYHPARVRSPIKKVSGGWRKISWDQALTEIAAKLEQLRSSNQSQSVACICDSDRGTVPELFKRFLTVYGSPNFMRMPSIQDSYELTLYLTQGTRGMAGFDIENTDYLLSFSSGLLEGWGSPVYMFRAKSAMHEHGGRMHQIESRLSKTAAKSEKWIPIRPGTEGALALGLAHVIIKEGLYKREFVEGYCNGFGEQKKLVIDAYTPEIVSKMTGVDARSIVSLARDFAKAKKPLAICGRGEGKTPGSLQEFLAVHALNALVGNINRPGGLWSVPEPDYIDWPEAEMDGVAAKAMQENRFDEAGTQDFPRARYLLTRLPDIINASAQSPIEALFISNANPVYSLPDSESVQKAFDQIPLVVSFSSFMDESAVHADYVLPNHVYLERIEDVPLALGFPKPLIGLVQPAVYPQLETRHTGDVIIQLAQQLGGTIADAFPWEEYETCLEETLADKWDSLTENGYWMDEQFAVADWDAAFETETNRFEFSNDTLSSLPQYNPVEPAGDETQYPLVLVPYDSMRLSAGYVGSPPFLMKSLEDTILQKNDVLVEVNPKTARKYGLREGGDALLSTPKASGRVKVHLFEGIMPDVIALPRGLGHTAYDKFLAQKGINYNRLVEPIEDVASGHDAAWGIRAKLVRA